MLKRATGWIQWTVVLALLPFLAQLGVDGLHKNVSSFDGLFGAGEGLVIAVAWLGAALSELSKASKQRKPNNLVDQVFWINLLFLMSSAIAYGIVVSNRDSVDDIPPHVIALVSVIDLSCSAILSMIGVAICTPKKKKKNST
jgi:hypothetical protein